MTDAAESGNIVAEMLKILEGMPMDIQQAVAENKAKAGGVVVADQHSLAQLDANGSRL